ncbi:sulfatase [Paenibacillus sp. ATY16]|uniref:sulfatase family protein n=1 Tax=Paenibacillus sp. ATY16 TaxID=1759312 RepID=UPI00200C0246|nr:sulfatase [Paenibacillus sp. ATY16]
MSAKRPNILFIMSDDHGYQAMSCYGSRINETPNLDRIANEGIRLNNCFCTNSICAPSRAVILSGAYSHVNGVKTLKDSFDGRQMTFPKLLQASGYQTAMIGKWHLGHGGDHDPTGFDYWNILPGQGIYRDPEFIEMGLKRTIPGYVTTVTTDLSLQWLQDRDNSRPFLLMCHYKAPHGPWQPDEKHAELYEDVDIPVPITFYDDYSNRASAAAAAKMRIDRDLPKRIPKYTAPQELSPEEAKKWQYQHFIKDYLRCVTSIDENVGRMLDYLKEEGLEEDTIVIYTSDQGFYLGDHGWYDKRFMYEESLRMPFLMRYPKEIPAGVDSDAFVMNVDLAPTFLDYAGIPIPEPLQGDSIREVVRGHVPQDWQTSVYYRYWMHLDPVHGVYSHYGVRTDKYKLIYYYGEALGASGTTDISTPKEWELFDLVKDPHELNNVYALDEYSSIVAALKTELERLRLKVGDVD